MKKIMILNTLILASSFFGCNPKEILEPNINNSYSIIDGDTIKTRDDRNKVLKNKFYSVPIDGTTEVLVNYDKLIKSKSDKKNDDIIKKGIEDPDLKGKTPRVIATGYGGTDGFGINNKKIEFGVSNLVANMMGVEFNNPYFEPSDFNGYATLVPSKDNFTKGPIPKLKQVINNLAIESIENSDNNIKLKKLKPGRYDNFHSLANGGYEQGGDKPMDPFYARFNSNLKYEQMILSQKFDFLIDIALNDDFTNNNGLNGFIPRQKYGNFSTQYTNSRLDMFSDLIKRKGVKGILINYSNTTPNLNTLHISVETIRKELAKYQKSHLLDLDAKSIFPTAQIDSLLSPVVNMNLKPFIRNDEKILSYGGRPIDESVIVSDKPRTSKLAQQLNWPELDVNFIYVSIYKGNYITYDGIKIKQADLYVLPNGFGGTSVLNNVILANEALKLINSFYGTTYPLYNTRDFINK